MTKEKNRRIGIDIINDVPWGAHFCLFYKTKEDLIDSLVPYFKAGLEDNEFCMWVTSETVSEEEATDAMRKAVPDFDRYLKKGQMEIIAHTEWYLKEGILNLQRVLDGWADKLNQALSKGFDGMRITGGTAWLEKKDWKNFANYEKKVNETISKCRMLAICTYSLDKCGASEIVDVVSNHQVVLIRREGRWELIESYERKQAEEKIVYEQGLMQTLLNNIPDYIYFKDINRRFVYASNYFCKLFNLDLKNILGKKDEDLFPKEIAEETSKEDQQVIETGTPLINKLEGGEIGGKENWVLTTKLPWRDKEDNIVGLFGFSKDVTELKEMEEDKIKAHVIMMAEERKRAMAEEMAQRLKKEVEEKTKEIKEAYQLQERFMVDASHELRTPLAVLQTNLDLLNSLRDTGSVLFHKDFENFIESSKSQITQLTHIIEELSLLSRGKKPEEFRKKVMLASVVQETAEGLRTLAEAKSIDYRIKILNPDLEIMGEEAMLRKLVSNLITNAIKYGREKGRVEITLREQADTAELQVSDNGIGIPKKDLPHIFERFYRINGGRTKGKGGIGLGLAICKWIVELHSGEIAVESEFGKGSTFRVSLPFEGGKNKN